METMQREQNFMLSSLLLLANQVCPKTKRLASFEELAAVAEVCAGHNLEARNLTVKYTNSTNYHNNQYHHHYHSHQATSASISNEGGLPRDSFTNSSRLNALPSPQSTSSSPSSSASVSSSSLASLSSSSLSRYDPMTTTDQMGAHASSDSPSVISSDNAPNSPNSLQEVVHLQQHQQPRNRVSKKQAKTRQQVVQDRKARKKDQNRRAAFNYRRKKMDEKNRLREEEMRLVYSRVCLIGYADELESSIMYILNTKSKKILDKNGNAIRFSCPLCLHSCESASDLRSHINVNHLACARETR